MADKSHIRAWLSSAAVQRWQEECGAHWTPLRLAACAFSSATGAEGILCNKHHRHSTKKRKTRRPPHRISKTNAMGESITTVAR